MTEKLVITNGEDVIQVLTAEKKPNGNLGVIEAPFNETVYHTANVFGLAMLIEDRLMFNSPGKEYEGARVKVVQQQPAYESLPWF